MPSRYLVVDVAFHIKYIQSRIRIEYIVCWGEEDIKQKNRGVWSTFNVTNSDEFWKKCRLYFYQRVGNLQARARVEKGTTKKSLVEIEGFQCGTDHYFLKNKTNNLNKFSNDRNPSPIKNIQK